MLSKCIFRGATSFVGLPMTSAGTVVDTIRAPLNTAQTSPVSNQISRCQGRTLTFWFALDAILFLVTSYGAYANCVRTLAHLSAPQLRGRGDNSKCGCFDDALSGLASNLYVATTGKMAERRTILTKRSTMR
jgi:hypothetical protein